MRKNYKIPILIIGLCLIVDQLALAMVFDSNSHIDKIINTTSIIGRLGGLILIFRESIVSRVFPYFQLVMFFLGVTTIGALMKIMHWPLASQLILTGIISIPIIYSVRIFAKKEKQLLDFLKLAWVISYGSYAFISIQHLPFKAEMLIIESVLFFLVYFKFSYEQFRVTKKSKLKFQ